MPYVPFHDLCPEIAMRETRVLTVLPGADVPLPPAQYSFVEMFCDESDCDCRRAFFTVYSSPGPKTEALISWGWENAAFYKRWLGFASTQLIETMQGPILEISSPVSTNAKFLLEFFSTVLLADLRYTERVKKHYAMFRAAIDSGTKRQRARPGSEAATGSATNADRDFMPISRTATSAGSGREWASLTQTRQQPEARQKVGRNDPCLCGSGKKFKNCCLK